MLSRNCDFSRVAGRRRQSVVRPLMKVRILSPGRKVDDVAYRIPPTLLARADEVIARDRAHPTDDRRQQPMDVFIVEIADAGRRRNQHPALLERQDCTLVAWYPCLTRLAREGRLTVTIGRRELLVALGG